MPIVDTAAWQFDRLTIDSESEQRRFGPYERKTSRPQPQPRPPATFQYLRAFACVWPMAIPTLLLSLHHEVSQGHQKPRLVLGADLPPIAEVHVPTIYFSSSFCSSDCISHFRSRS